MNPVQSYLKADPKPKRKRRPTLAQARLEVERRCGGRCEARIPEVCTGRYEHAHHIRLRSQGGRDEASNLLAVCEADHRWIHANPAAAAELGLIQRSTPEPLSSAVRSISRVVRTSGETR